MSERLAGRMLSLIVVVYLILGVAYSVVNPVFESPDESLNYANIRFMIEEQRLPVLQPDEPTKAHHPPLYYVLGALLIHRVPDDNFDAITERVNPFWIHRVDEYSADNKNLYLHDPTLEQFPYQDVALGVRLVRWLSLLMGAATLLLIYRTAQELIPGRPSLWVVTVALVAFNPMFVYISTSVHDDVLANLVTAAMLLSTAKLMMRGVTVRRAVELGVLTGLAILTKLTCLLITPAVALAVLWRLWLDKGRIRVEDVLRFGGTVVLLALLVGGWWLGRNQLVYGEPTSMERQVQAWGGLRDGAPNLAAGTRELGFLHDSFWGVFGYGQIPMPGWTYGLYRLLGLIALGGLVLLWMRWRSEGTGPARGGAIHLPRGGLAIMLSVPLVTFLVIYVRMMFIDTANFGRYLFVSMGFVAPLYAIGLGEWVRERDAKWLAGGLVSTTLVLAVFALARVLHPAYAAPAILSSDEVEGRVKPAELRFGESVGLGGHKLDPQRVQPGGETRVTLCWESLNSMDEDFVYFVQLVGPDEMVVGARTTHPGLGRYPTSRWSPGDRFCDTLEVQVEEDAPAPAVYDVVIGWHESGCDQLLPAYAADGSELEWVLLDRIKVAPARAAYATVPNPVDADLGAEISLLGYGLEGLQVTAGDTLSVTLYWKARDRPSADYTVFLHLAAPDGPPYAQQDGPPAAGTNPTSFWDNGEVVMDPRLLHIPSDLPPGEYPLVTGMYLLETGERLPYLAPDGSVQGDAVFLATVRVH